LNDEYGDHAIELRDEVIGDIQVVTIGDFQTVICEAIRIYFDDSDGDRLRKYIRERVVDLRGNTVEEKRSALDRASRLVSGAAYAEARIFRPLRKEDKLAET
jgi:hypothetical protein